MKSGPLTRPPGSLSSNKWLLSMLLGTLEKGGWIILLGINTEVWRKSGYKKARSCFPYISPSTWWIWAKFDIYRKLFSRGIQRHRLWEIWRRTCREHWVYQEI